MPKISEFYGIVIRMYYNDHLPPHFHAQYSNDNAAISIGSGIVIAGNVPPRVLALITEWAKMHKRDLEENWERARSGLPLQDIDPLD
jgi:hypothetical protein